MKVLTEMVGTRLEPDSRTQLELLAHAHGRTMSQEVRLLIIRRLQLARADGEFISRDAIERQEQVVVA